MATKSEFVRRFRAVEDEKHDYYVGTWTCPVWVCEQVRLARASFLGAGFRKQGLHRPLDQVMCACTVEDPGWFVDSVLCVETIIGDCARSEFWLRLVAAAEVAAMGLPAGDTRVAMLRGVLQGYGR